MKQYPIPMIRLGPDVLQEQDTLAHLRSIRRPQRLREDRDTSPPQSALSDPRTKHPQPVRRTERPAAVSMKGMVPASQIDATITRKVRRNHRSVEADEIRLLLQPAVQRSVIAVPDERLWVGAYERLIQMRQQLSRAPTTASTYDPIDRRIGKRSMQISQPMLDRPRVVEWPAIQRMRTKRRPVSKRLKPPQASLHQLLFRSTSRRQHSQRSAGTQS